MEDQPSHPQAAAESNSDQTPRFSKQCPNQAVSDSDHLTSWMGSQPNNAFTKVKQLTLGNSTAKHIFMGNSPVLKGPVTDTILRVRGRERNNREKAQAGIEPMTLLSQVMHSTAVLQPLHNFSKANVFLKMEFKDGYLFFENEKSKHFDFC